MDAIDGKKITDLLGYFDLGTRIDVGETVVVKVDGIEHVATIMTHEIVGTWYHSLRHHYMIVDNLYQDAE